MEKVPYFAQTFFRNEPEVEIAKEANEELTEGEEDR
jgi:hypothetical protein